MSALPTLKLTRTSRRTSRTRVLAAAAAVTAALSVTACSSDDSTDEDTSDGTTAAETTEAAPLPTAEELNDVLNRAVAPGVPAEEKVDTVQNGDQAVELFDVMTNLQEENNSTFVVVDPVMPGLVPDSVQTQIEMTVPDQEPNTIDGVQFVSEDGQWKLSQEWACTLVSNVAPDQIPPSCEPLLGDAPAPEGAPAPEDAPAPAPEDAPAPEA